MNKKIIAIVFIVLFTASLGVVFFYSPDNQDKVGYVNVSRGETYWQNVLGNVTDSRYLIDYGIYVISDAPKITITDQAEAHLTQIPLDQETSNIKVIYNADTGVITVVATNLKANDKVSAQAAFLMDPVDVFAPDERPTTTVTPNAVYWGDKTSVDVNISPFSVIRPGNVSQIGVYAWLTDAVETITNATTTPPTTADPPMYQAIWQYKFPETRSYGAHDVKYSFKLPLIARTGNVLLRTWVEVRYTEALRMKADGVLEGADGYFFRVDSAISYQYEHPISTRPIG